MVTSNIKLSVMMAFFLFCLGSTVSWAESHLAVVLESQGDQVVINRGSADGVRVGQTWVLGEDEKTGALIIEQIREHSASGRLQGDASVGSLASLGTEADVKPFVTRANVAKEMTQQRSTSARASQAIRRKYKRALDKRTERRGFVTQIRGAGGGMATGQVLNLGVEAYNAYRIYDLSRDIGLNQSGFYSPWWLAASAVQTVGGQMQRKKMLDRQRVRVDVEAILWDPSLVDLQTEVMAIDQGLSLKETLAKKVAMQSKRGVDKYTVFEVSLKNVGKLPAQTGKFKYKMFLLSSEGRPISASRVDPVLDKTLQPGDKVRGMVYFPRIVAAGQGSLKVAFEQMYGDRGELTFKTR